MTKKCVSHVHDNVNLHLTEWKVLEKLKETWILNIRLIRLSMDRIRRFSQKKKKKKFTFFLGKISQSPAWDFVEERRCSTNLYERNNPTRGRRKCRDTFHYLPGAVVGKNIKTQEF